MKKKSLLKMLLCFWLLISGVISAPRADTLNSSPTVTRLVKLFYEQESEIISALKSKDSKKLSLLLTEDFELRGAPLPATPVPRSEWLSQSLAEAGSYSDNIEQMAVHGLNETAVVSYLWKSAQSGQHPSSDVFVVDIWSLDKENVWKLSIRYVSSASSANGALPGFTPPSEVIEKRF